LWRRTYALFEEVRGEEGLFHLAGYKRKRFERDEDGVSPDLIAADPGRDFFVASELSIGTNKNLTELDKYSGLDLSPYILGQLGLSDDVEEGAGPLFLGIDQEYDGPPPSEASVLDLENWRVVREGDIYDSELASALEAWSGFSVPIPSFSIDAVPESPPEEIRPKLSGQFHRYAMMGETVTPEEVAEHLLGDLTEFVQRSARRDLEENVEALMREAGDILDDYAEWDHSQGALVFEKIDSAQARQAHSRRLDEWEGRDNPQVEDFDPSEDDGEAADPYDGDKLDDAQVDFLDTD
jgi:hypothetical protein